MFTWIYEMFNRHKRGRGKYDDFAVEHYPLANTYFASYKGQYLKRGFQTGLVERIDTGDKSFGILYATKCSTEEHAWALIDLFIEQYHKEGVTVFRR